MWGATILFIFISTLYSNFNPRTHVGCDCCPSLASSTLNKFQSTHPCGVRHFWDTKKALQFVFQSTHPCGVRLIYTNKKEFLKIFQSTHPCGVRLETFIESAVKQIFQSTHPCGVRLSLTKNSLYFQMIFQSTHPCGVRQPLQLKPFFCFFISIHAPMWGAT